MRLLTCCVGRKIDLHIHFPTRFLREEGVLELSIDVERRDQEKSFESMSHIAGSGFLPG